MENKYPGCNCEGCPLRSQPFVPPEVGDEALGVIIGEAPGASEAAKGKPFVGRSGKFLMAALKGQGYDRSDFNYDNVVLCRPPNNRDPSIEEYKCCSGHLKRWENVKHLLVSRLAMEHYGIEERHVWYGDTLATWHPAYILRNPSMSRQFIAGIQKFLFYPPVEVHPTFFVAETPKEVLDFLATCTETPVVDLETEQRFVFKNKILCAQVCDGIDSAVVIPMPLLEHTEVVAGLKDLFRRTDWGGHNVKFDMNFMHVHLGIEFTEDLAPHFDTMLAQYLIDEEAPSYGLKQLSTYYFNAPDYEGKLIKKYIKNAEKDTYDKIPKDLLYEYGVLDVAYNWLLWRYLDRRLEGKQRELYWASIMPAVWAFHKAEMLGMLIDADSLQELEGKLEQTRIDAREELEFIYDEVLTDSRMKLQVTDFWKSHPKGIKAGGVDKFNRIWASIEQDGFNPDSVQQVQFLLYDLLGLPPDTSERHGYRSTNFDVLTHLVDRHPAVQHLLTYRRVAKLKRSYATPLLEKRGPDGRIHATFWLHRTRNGRLAVTDPPLQTIPRPGDVDDPLSYLGNAIRRCFIAPEGCLFVVVDYSQAELRTVAAESQERYLLDAFRHDRDVHGEVTKGVFGSPFTAEQRHECKRLVFCYIYGGSPYNFAQDYAVPLDKAILMFDQLNQLLPDLARYRKEQFQFMKEHGYVESRLGRRRRMPYINKINMMDARKYSLNAPIQADAHELTFRAFIELTRQGYRMVHEVHDSVLFEVEESEAEAKVANAIQVMEQLGEQYYPEVPWKADADVNTRWEKV